MLSFERHDLIIAAGVAAGSVALVIIFWSLGLGPNFLVTTIIPLLLGVGLFYGSWFFYFRDDNVWGTEKVKRKNIFTGKYEDSPKTRRGRNVTSGFLAVAIGTAFFIPTLSLITTYLEQPPYINNIESWSNNSVLVNINYPNPLHVPIKNTLESLINNMTVNINHPNSITILRLDLVSPEDSIISTNDSFRSINNQSNMDVFEIPFYTHHFDEISNKTYNYSLIMSYTNTSNNSTDIKQATIPFNWTIIMKDLPWLNYLWIVMAGVVASRFITFIADTRKEEPIDIDRTESLWIAFTFIIAVIAFASFKENVTPGSIVIFNVLASFAFGFGSQKVLELARVFPGTSTPTPVQVVGLKATPESKQIKLEWDPNPETDFDHYNIYRGQAPHFIITAQAPTGMSPEPSYTDTALIPNHNYYYRVSAVNKAGSIGPHSSELSTKTTDET